jgi:hypothetical protein
MPLRFRRYAFAWLLLFGLGRMANAAVDLKVVVLDSKDGHALKGKLVCISLPLANPSDPVVQHPRDCQRTDSGGTATFSLREPAPQTVDITLASDGLVPCFSPHTFPLADAMKVGLVANNTCGSASTDTTETGEVVVFGHQKSLKEAMNSVRNEF